MKTSLSHKTKRELKKIKKDYVKQYIGDHLKPLNYKQDLDRLDRLIKQKQ